MDLSFVKDSKAFSEAVESLRGNTALTEENIKDAYEKIVAAKSKGKKADLNDADAAKIAKADEAAAKKAAKEAAKKAK